MNLTRKSTRLLAAVTGLALAGTGLMASTANAALPAGTPPAGAITITPSSGTASTNFNFGIPAGAACSGDSASNNYFWSTFLVPNSVDASQLTWDGSGNPIAPGGAQALPLFSAGTPVTAQNTAIGTGALTGLSPMNLASYPANLVPAGIYKVGIACWKGADTDRYWQANMAISVNGSGVITGYSPAVLPSAPTLSSPLTAGDQSLSGTFSAPAATPAATSYLVTATPQPSGTPVTATVTAPATSFSLTGLTNGTTYSVTVATTNAVGTGAASNAVTGTPFNPSQMPAPTIAAAPGAAAGSVDVAITAPADTQPRTGYQLVVTTGGSPIAGSPFSVGATATSYPVSGLTAGTAYSFQLTATYAAPYFGTPSNTVTVTPLAAQVLIQDITVVRPAGALVLAQRCGVNGALPARTATSNFPVALPAVQASADQTGTAPTLNGGGTDPQFGNYPNPQPATYPTRCGINMGTASLVTSGPMAGSYYLASGYLNQISVLDARDTDSGWTVNGTMSDFTTPGTGNVSFSGNYLGWNPVTTSDSLPTTAGYDQVVTAGGAVEPLGPGLGTSKPLASAAAGAGLGVATLDARLELLVPSTVRAGTYTGTLTFTII